MKNIRSNSRRVMITLFVLLLSVAGMKNTFAQQQVAILQHNDTLSAFYGPNALNLAHTAAADGDTITLSSGNFEGCTLSKAITIHGAGCVTDTANHLPSTRITSNIYISKPDGTLPLTLEGIWFGQLYHGYSQPGPLCRNVKFIKCNIDYIYYSSHYCSNFYFDNCIIKDFRHYGEGTIIQNSVVKFVNYTQSNMNFTNFIYNSVVLLNNNVTLNNSRVFNCIFATGDNNTASNTTFDNCINIKRGNSNLFEGQLNYSNMQVNSYEEVFETFAGTITYNNIYQLKDEIATTFLGNDGTEVGIYGGMNPYSSHPLYMIIRNTHVAGRTTEDDKLSVEIELNLNGN